MLRAHARRSAGSVGMRTSVISVPPAFCFVSAFVALVAEVLVGGRKPVRLFAVGAGQVSGIGGRRRAQGAIPAGVGETDARAVVFQIVVVVFLVVVKVRLLS